MSFFPKSTFLNIPPIGKIPKCGQCGLFKKCKSPKMKPSGDFQRKILIVAESPGETDDLKNTQLIGMSGSFLEDALHDVGINMRRDCLLTNSIVCRPTDKQGSNRPPTTEELEYCLPNLQNTILQHRPETIIVAGAHALRSVLHGIWNGRFTEGVGQWAGWKIPCQKLNAWVCPIYHPTYVLREQNKRGGTIIPKLFSKHLRAIAKLKARPWKKIPKFKQQIEPIFSEREAANAIRKFRQQGGTSAFDYETNMLKPDSAESEIVSASICWRGKETIAFPFQGCAVDEFKKWLLSPCRKIAQNMKFEDRWTRAKLGIEVNNWYWDTMTNAHILDNRSGCTGLGFQALVHLGVSSWDDHIHPFLVAEYTNTKNRIKEINFEDLLIYNGLDSLFEYKIAMKQIRQLAANEAALKKAEGE